MLSDGSQLRWRKSDFWTSDCLNLCSCCEEQDLALAGGMIVYIHTRPSDQGLGLHPNVHSLCYTDMRHAVVACCGLTNTSH
jgi:hypothetical protein